jgi:hypothetical protein
MLLDELLNDVPAMRRLARLLRGRSQTPVDVELHESFLDHAALHEELARSLAVGAEAAAGHVQTLRSDAPGFRAPTRQRAGCAVPV